QYYVPVLLPVLPGTTLFPYTTLFRSRRAGRLRDVHPHAGARRRAVPRRAGRGKRRATGARVAPRPDPARRADAQHRRLGRAVARSEEHTSELQSREKLVCRLLLEKKK